MQRPGLNQETVHGNLGLQKFLTDSMTYSENLSGGNIPGEKWYVDSAKAGDGTSWDKAFATIAEAIANVSSFDVINVAPGTYTENLDTGVSGAARSVSLLGWFNGYRSENRATILGTGAVDHIVDVKAQGWRVSGFRLAVADSTKAAIRLNMESAAETAGDAVAPFFTLDNCLVWLNGYGIHSNGAPHSVNVINNEFQSNSGAAIYNSDTGVKAMANWTIKNNFFNGNTNDVNLIGTCSNNVVQDNNFNDSGATRVLWFDSASSANNLVTRNAFGGTYDISNGYKAGSATNIWSGNYGVAAVTSGVPA